MIDPIENDLDDFQAKIEEAVKKRENTEKLNKALEEKKAELQVATVKEVKDNLPAQNAEKHGKIVLTRMDGIGLTETGELTTNKFFERQRQYRDELYGDIALTSEEARTLSISYGSLASGSNSTIPLICTGPDCFFAHNCPYQKIDKAPITLPCILENDLLLYHTERLMRHFEVDPENYVDMMLIQKISENIIYEMRMNRILSEGEGALLMQEDQSMDAAGNLVITRKSHWAWEAKEKTHNRTLKLLDALMGTRKNKQPKQEKADAGSILGGMYAQFADLKDKLVQIQKNQIQDATYVKIEEN